MYSSKILKVVWLFLFSLTISTTISVSSGDGLLISHRILGDYDFLGKYSIKFQGCHRIAQWKYEEKSNNHVYFQNLVRFRLCSENTCSNDTSVGCTSNYGEYLLELSSFLYNILTMETNYDDINAMIKSIDYTSCSAFENFVGYSADNTDAYYIGPYCPKQGGSIYLGLFTDNTCSTLSKCDSGCFKDITGYSFPQQALITRNCISCASSSNDVYYGPKYQCMQVYKQAGKCESKMHIQHPNLSECKYLAGVKATGQDGILRNTKGGGNVTVLITFLAVCCILIGTYIVYLRRKITRADSSFLYGNRDVL